MQVFSAADYSLQTATVPINLPASYTLPSGTVQDFPASVNTLTRWGANGLVVHTPIGIFPIQSNAVVDLSATQADLGISAVATPATTTGTTVSTTFTVTNHGPSTATDVVVQAPSPTLGIVMSVTPSAGTCNTDTVVLCSLGNLANGATATVTVAILQTDAGTSTLTAQASTSATDPLAINNSAQASTSVTGTHYSVAATVVALSPASVQAGAGATTVTVKGIGFYNGATVYWNGTALATTYVSAAQLKAVVPAAQVASLGWGAITVGNPAPSGGISNSKPFTVYTVTAVLANSIVYEPYSRRIFASVNASSTGITPNSVVGIQPETGVVGTPVYVGTQPTRMAVTSNGQELYTLLTGTPGLSRVNLLTGASDLNVSFGTSGVTPQDIAALPGSDTTIAVDGGAAAGIWLYDINAAANTATPRTAVASTYTGTCLTFLSSSTLYSVDSVLSANQLYSSAVSSSGLTTTYYDASTVTSLGCIKIDRGLLFGRAGAVANPSTKPATPIGIFPVSTADSASTPRSFAPDAAIGRVFFPVSTSLNGSSTVDGIAAFDANSYLQSGTLSLNVPASSAAPYDAEMEMLRWGQDGLALLSSDGHLYLLRGGFVLPQLLTTATAATLTGNSSPTVAHGTGNTLLTLTGNNFLPGVAVTFKGAYRTTTLVDTTHVTVALPASDLATSGTGNFLATNPGAPASNPLPLVIQ